MFDAIHMRHHCSRLLTVARVGALVAVLAFVDSRVASAHFGNSFMKIPGTKGQWQGAQYRSWIRIGVSYWSFRPTRLNPKSIDGDRLFFSGPSAPRPGTASTLVISMDKHDPDFPQLMDECSSKTKIPEVTYAESSDGARTLLEVGQRPEKSPGYWEYKLKGVQFSDCPVVSDADEQAFVVSFEDIEWLNYDGKGPDWNQLQIEPKDLPKVEPAKKSAKSKAFVITWIAPANYVSDDQCPVMNTKPTEDNYYALVPAEEAAKERVANAKHGGVSFGGLSAKSQMENRGPHRLNACKVPGTVRDPGFAEPKTSAAYGVNLDGDDGSGPPPAGTCKHRNYTSLDGQLRGIDNQLYTVLGCVAGYQGKKGYRYQTSNSHRADGTITTLVEISGIDNEKNDSSVDIAVMYSHDHVGRDPSGKHFIPDFTFRPTDDPQLALYAVRLHGRIVDGVIITDPVRKFEMNMGLDPLLTMHDSQMRLQILPDGNLKGVLAGYVDWRRGVMEASAGSYSEDFFGYQAPGLYHELQRAADGLKDPVTGECDGISAAYEVEGVPAYITSVQSKTAKTDAHAHIARAELTSHRTR
jgi:hypothetical protein